MKRICSCVMELLLALVLLLSLCGCTRKLQTGLEEWGIDPGQQAEESKEEGGSQTIGSQEPLKKVPGTPFGGSRQPGTADAELAQVGFTEAGEMALYWLRQNIGLSSDTVRLGVAYLGYTEGIPEGQTDAEDTRWLSEINRAMAQEYPFMTELNADHVVGNGGNLYCIVPLDEQATLAINRVEWNGKTGTSKVTEILYRSESGEPVLLFDNGSVGAENDLQVLITDSNGHTCEWQPLLDEEGCVAPCLDQNEKNVLYDFSEYGWLKAPAGFAELLSNDWGGPTALGLAGLPDEVMGGHCWYVQTTSEDFGREGVFYLWLQYQDETGGVLMLDWLGDGIDSFEEVWNGYWTIETAMDAPSRLMITVSLDGKPYGVYLSEIYPILISPSGLELVLGPGENGIDMPILAQLTQQGPCTLTRLEYGPLE